MAQPSKKAKKNARKMFRNQSCCSIQLMCGSTIQSNKMLRVSACNDLS